MSNHAMNHVFLFLILFSAIAAALLFVNTYQIRIKRAWYAFIIPAYILSCLSLYSSVIKDAGYPSYNEKELFSHEFTLIEYTQQGLNELYLVVLIPGETSIKSYVVNDPQGKVREQIEKSQNGNDRNGTFIPVKSKMETDATGNDIVTFVPINMDDILQPKS